MYERDDLQPHFPRLKTGSVNVSDTNVKAGRPTGKVWMAEKNSSNNGLMYWRGMITPHIRTMRSFARYANSSLSFTSVNRTSSGCCGGVNPGPQRNSEKLTMSGKM